jgi:hypothetical protein
MAETHCVPIAERQRSGDQGRHRSQPHAPARENQKDHGESQGGVRQRVEHERLAVNRLMADKPGDHAAHSRSREAEQAIAPGRAGEEQPPEQQDEAAEHRARHDGHENRKVWRGLLQEERLRQFGGHHQNDKGDRGPEPQLLRSNGLRHVGNGYHFGRHERSLEKRTQQKEPSEKLSGREATI